MSQSSYYVREWDIAPDCWSKIAICMVEALVSAYTPVVSFQANAEIYEWLFICAGHQWSWSSDISSDLSYVALDFYFESPEVAMLIKLMWA